VARLARSQKEREEALARRAAEEEAEAAFWINPEVIAELAQAERALEPPPAPVAPAQELIVLAGPPEGPDSGLALVEKGSFSIPAFDLA
jgi:hypothetical protein